MVGCRRLPAAVASPAVMAVRRRRIRVRTRVRFARLTSARSRDCAARFKTDFFFFLTLVACPWAIYCSFCVSLKLLTLNEAYGFVKQAERVVRVNLFGRSRAIELDSYSLFWTTQSPKMYPSQRCMGKLLTALRSRMLHSTCARSWFGPLLLAKSSAIRT